MPDAGQVTELRLVVTSTDYDEAVHFYRDGLGLREQAVFTSEGGHVTILSAGRATIELADPAHAAYVDRIEVGDRATNHHPLGIVELPPPGTRWPAAHIVQRRDALMDEVDEVDARAVVLKRFSVDVDSYAELNPAEP